GRLASLHRRRCDALEQPGHWVRLRSAVRPRLLSQHSRLWSRRIRQWRHGGCTNGGDDALVRLRPRSEPPTLRPDGPGSGRGGREVRRRLGNGDGNRRTADVWGGRGVVSPATPLSRPKPVEAIGYWPCRPAIGAEFCGKGLHWLRAPVTHG